MDRYAINDNGLSGLTLAKLMALVNRAATMKAARTPTRNEPYSCGSGKKYWKCCG